jgi:hypothetical protein
LRQNSLRHNTVVTARAPLPVCSVLHGLGARIGHEASAAAAPGVYKPRRPQASPLFRLVSDHVRRLQTVYDERIAREYGPGRPVVGQVADKFLAIPKRLRAYCLYRRRLLGEIARVAARTITAAPCSGSSCAANSSTRTKPPGCSGLPRPLETDSADAMKHFFRWIRLRRAVRLS